MKKTAHIIYPFNLKKNINPWSIGNNLYLALKKKYNIKIYTWTSLEKINPNKNDLLIGHAHTNPYTIFRRSINNENWYKKILIQPFNCDPKQMSHLYDLIPVCDEFIAICGKFWIKNLKKTIFKKWEKKINQIDLGIDRKKYPFIKKKFSESGKRKFIYIGNDYAYNNYAKNTKFLEKISRRININYLSTIGNKKIGNINHYGWLDLNLKKNQKLISGYDFLIQTSNFDANPSTVLESISWGLVPVITRQCGYTDFNKNTYLPLNNVDGSLKIINKLQKLEKKIIYKIQRDNLKKLNKIYAWDKFRRKINLIINKKNKKIHIKYTKNEIKIFEENKKNSPNYYLRINNIFSIIKTNLKILLINPNV